MTVSMDRAGQAARMLQADMNEWLRGGMGRKDGRLALFDLFAEPIDKQLIRKAIAAGLAEPWFASPMSPQWTVCRLTQKGRDYLSGKIQIG